MIYLRFKYQDKEKYGLLEGKTVHEITPDYFRPFKKTGNKYPLSKVKLLAPCAPAKIVALGLNYIGHAKELKMPMPLEPLIFLKASSCVIGPGENIEYPSMSKRVDFEGELAVVIKKKAKNVPVNKAAEYILGYTCLNDVTARDLQSRDGQWTRAKSFDTFAPLGPWIAAGIDVSDLKLQTFLNGKKKQDSSTSDLIFKIEEIVHFVSKVMTLMPGDVIATGTPSGIGPMERGDKVEVRIENIGSLINTIR